jgi:hypothetical protein
MGRYKPIDTSPSFIAVDLQRQLLTGNVEVTGAARPYRAASVWTAGLGVYFAWLSSTTEQVKR